jgi:hypothetical protein
MSVDPACPPLRGAQGSPDPSSDVYRSQGDAGEGDTLLCSLILFDVLPYEQVLDRFEDSQPRGVVMGTEVVLDGCTIVSCLS